MAVVTGCGRAAPVIASCACVFTACHGALGKRPRGRLRSKFFCVLCRMHAQCAVPLHAPCMCAGASGGWGKRLGASGWELGVDLSWIAPTNPATDSRRPRPRLPSLHSHGPSHAVDRQAWLSVSGCKMCTLVACTCAAAAELLKSSPCCSAPRHHPAHPPPPHTGIAPPPAGQAPRPRPSTSHSLPRLPALPAPHPCRRHAS